MVPSLAVVQLLTNIGFSPLHIVLQSINFLFPLLTVYVNLLYSMVIFFLYYSLRENYYEIQAGITQQNTFSPKAQLRKVVQIVVHNDFHPQTMNNDIALMRLEEPLFFDRWIRSICIPTDVKFPPAFVKCTIAGWGASRENGYAR